MPVMMFMGKGIVRHHEPHDKQHHSRLYLFEPVHPETKVMISREE